MKREFVHIYYQVGVSGSTFHVFRIMNHFIPPLPQLQGIHSLFRQNLRRRIYYNTQLKIHTGDKEIRQLFAVYRNTASTDAGRHKSASPRAHVSAPLSSNGDADWETKCKTYPHPSASTLFPFVIHPPSLSSASHSKGV